MQNKKLFLGFIIVGVGGTGGNLAKELCRYISNLSKTDQKRVSVAFVDGDMIEQKNCSRQPFLNSDVNQNKAAVLAEAVGDNFGVDVYSFGRYIDTEADVGDIANTLAKSYEERGIHRNHYDVFLPVILSCVDNHRARQVFHEFYKNHSTVLYFDAANEFSVGEVVFSSKISGKELSPPRGFYFPDILKDKSPSKSEESCGVVNESAPQHLATNLLSANILLSGCVQLVSDNSIPEGIVYFDSFKFFVRHRSYSEYKKAGEKNESK